MIAILHGFHDEEVMVKVCHVIVDPAVIRLFVADDEVVDAEEITLYYCDNEIRRWRNLETGEQWKSVELCQR